VLRNGAYENTKECKLFDFILRVLSIEMAILLAKNTEVKFMAVGNNSNNCSLLVNDGSTL
jgi:hypothetical protein